MFSIAVSMLTAPINLIVDFLFLDILAAPTMESLKRGQAHEDRAKIRVGIQRTASMNRLSDSAEGTISLFNPLTWVLKETRLLPPQTREAQFMASITSQEVVKEVWKSSPLPPPISTGVPKKGRDYHEEEEEVEPDCEQPKSVLKREMSLSHRAGSRSQLERSVSRIRSFDRPALLKKVSSLSPTESLDDQFQRFLTELKLQRTKLFAQQLWHFDQSWW
jgi:hypothetical protein